MRRAALLFAALLGAAAAVRLPLLFKPLWCDEIFSTFVYLKNVTYFAGLLLYDGVLPVYYGFMFFWIRLFGESEVAVRVPAFAAGLATIVLVYVLARRTTDRTTAWLAAAWLAFSPVHVWYSAEARPYMPLVLLVLGGAYCFVRMIESRRAGVWDVLFAVLLSAAAWTHYYAGAFVPVCALYLYLKRRSGAHRAALLFSFGALAAVSAYLFLRHGTEPFPTYDYLRRFTAAEAWTLFFNWFLCGNTLWPIGPYAGRLVRAHLERPWLLAVEAVCFFYFVRGVRALFRDGDRGKPVLVFLAVMPAFHLAFSASGLGSGYIERSAIASLPFFAIVLARGFTSVRGKALRIAGIAFLVALQAASLAFFFLRQDRWTVYKPKGDWRAAARYFGAEHRAGQKRILILSANSTQELYYYDRRLFDARAQKLLRNKVTRAHQITTGLLGKTHPFSVRLEEDFMNDPALSGKWDALPVKIESTTREDVLEGFDTVYLVRNLFWEGSFRAQMDSLTASGMKQAGTESFEGVEIYKMRSTNAAAGERKPVSEYSSAGRSPFMARLVLPSGAQPGVYQGDVRVRIRNVMDTAFVLRGARWDYRPEARTWRERLPGRIEPDSGGSLLVDTSAEGTTDRAFEKGLLRPGDEVDLILPLTPQIFGRHDLILKYGPLGPGWENETVIEESLSSKGPGKIKIAYHPASTVPSGKRGRNALYAPTADPGKPDPFAVYDAVIGFEFPLGKQPKGKDLAAIARKAGIDLLNESWWAFYKGPLDTWIFVRDDGRASALREGKYELLPRMDVTVPDELCAEEGPASLKIGAEAAEVSCAEFWEVMEKARLEDVFVARG